MPGRSLKCGSGRGQGRGESSFILCCPLIRHESITRAALYRPLQRAFGGTHPLTRPAQVQAYYSSKLSSRISSFRPELLIFLLQSYLINIISQWPSATPVPSSSPPSRSASGAVSPTAKPSPSVSPSTRAQSSSSGSKSAFTSPGEPLPPRIPNHIKRKYANECLSPLLSP